MKLMRLLSVAVSLLAAFAAPSGAARVVENLFAAKLLDENRGWVVGAFGAVYRTDDGGATWDTQKTPTLDDLFSIDFSNEMDGVVVGKAGTILRTDDGGRTWTKIDGGTNRNLFAVAFASRDHVWAVGDWGAVFESVDGGETWKDRTLSDDIVLTDMAWADAQHGALVGEFGSVRITDDGGVTWRPSDVGTDKTLFGVDFRSPTDGWVVGIDGLILRTRDGGETWDLQRGQRGSSSLAELGALEALRNPGLYDISFSDEFGYVVGDIGMMLVSADGGENWAEHKLPAEMALLWVRGVSAAPGDHAVVAGANGLTARFDRGEVLLQKGDG
ncbi:MAG: YCF48-related protein [Candidatus Binatia bacterium]|nr:YCF48-related protein [Candidatus Binatia bacterium]